MHRLSILKADKRNECVVFITVVGVVRFKKKKKKGLMPLALFLSNH